MEDVAAPRPPSRASSEGALRPTAPPPATVAPSVEPSPVAELVRTLRWRWRPALALAVLFALGVVAYAESLPDEFEALAVVAVEPRETAGIDDDVVDRLVPKYAAYATAEATDRTVSSRLGLEPGAADVHARVVFESGLVQVFVRDDSAELAARRADALARELERFSVRDPRLDALVVSPAEVPAAPSGPPRRALEAAGVVAGLLLAASLVLLVERLRPRARSIRDVEALTGFRLIGRVPLSAAGSPGMPAAPAAALSGALERRLRRDTGVVALVAASGDEAEAAVVRSLAEALASSERAVLLVERRPAGLAAAAPVERGDQERAARLSQLSHYDARADEDLKAVIAKGRSDYDLTLVAPAPGDETDAAAAASVADGVVLVVAVNAPAGRIRAAAVTVAAAAAPPLGFVAVGFGPPSESASVFAPPSAA